MVISHSVRSVGRALKTSLCTVSTWISTRHRWNVMFVASLMSHLEICKVTWCVILITKSSNVICVANLTNVKINWWNTGGIVILVKWIFMVTTYWMNERLTCLDIWTKQLLHFTFCVHKFNLWILKYSKRSVCLKNGYKCLFVWRMEISVYVYSYCQWPKIIVIIIWCCILIYCIKLNRYKCCWCKYV